MRLLVWFGLCILFAGCGRPAARLRVPASLERRAPEVFRAEFVTTQGAFVIEVHRAWAPGGADRFYSLVRGGFYDGARFFRVIPNWVVQWGLPAGPDVAAAWKKQTLVDDVVRERNTRGMVSYATDGPATRTTQVYINLADNAARLDKRGFAPFGRVVAGMEVVEKFYAGYGEGPPRGNGADQARIGAEGEAYLAQEFPKLDKIIRARVVR